MSTRRSRALAGTIVTTVAAMMIASGGVEIAASFTGAGVAEPTCLATPVQLGTNPTVRAGPFVGYIAPPYDVFNDRFRLHVGPLRDPARGLSQKIPWFLRGRVAGTTTSLVVVGTRIGPRPQRQFRQTFRSNSRRFWPTIIKPPFPGCWRLQLRSGRATGSLIVLVEPATASQPPADQPIACAAGEVEALATRFVGSFNDGDFEGLDGIFAQEPDFEWYSTGAPGERLLPLAGDRATLVPYFRERHDLGERLAMQSFRFNGNTIGAWTYGNFEYTLTRSASDLAPTAYAGKGAALCYRNRADLLIVWSMGRA